MFSKLFGVQFHSVKNWVLNLEKKSVIPPQFLIFKSEILLKILESNNNIKLYKEILNIQDFEIKKIYVLFILYIWYHISSA